MPARPKSTCRKDGCVVLLDRPGFCSDHKPQAFANKSVRGAYGYDWSKRIRPAVMRRDNGLCQVCKSRGILSPAQEVDHIVNIAEGGSDSFDNLQAICIECHRAKTNKEKKGSHKGQPLTDDLIHPNWIRRAAMPVTIVCGAAGSGKSTYVATHLSDGDIVIDLDAIRLSLGLSLDDKSTDAIGECLATRNRMLDALHTKITDKQAWFIVSEPVGLFREDWAKMLGAEKVLVMMTPLNECLSRINATRSGFHKVKSLHAAQVWWDKYEPSSIDTVISVGARGL